MTWQKIDVVNRKSLTSLVELVVAINDGSARKGHCDSLKIENALAVARNRVVASTGSPQMAMVKTSLCSSPTVTAAVDAVYLVHAYFAYLKSNFFCHRSQLNCQSCDCRVN